MLVCRRVAMAESISVDSATSRRSAVMYRFRVCTQGNTHDTQENQASEPGLDRIRALCCAAAAPQSPTMATSSLMRVTTALPSSSATTRAAMSRSARPPYSAAPADSPDSSCSE